METTATLTKHDSFQYDGNSQKLNPVSEQSLHLVKQFEEKMPDEIIEFRIKNEMGEQGRNKTDYSISKKLDFINPEKAPVLFLESTPMGERAISLQKWRGIVEEVKNNFFTAKLINLTDRGYDEWCEISFDKIAEEDIEFIKPGAFFYWSIGYNHSAKGQRKRFSDIRFKRVPVWSKKEIMDARKQAKETSDLVNWK